jgi:hypothetical protein
MNENNNLCEELPLCFVESSTLTHAVQWTVFVHSTSTGTALEQLYQKRKKITYEGLSNFLAADDVDEEEEEAAALNECIKLYCR